MKKKTKSIFMIVCISLSIFSIAILSLGLFVKSSPDFPEYVAMDFTEDMRKGKSSVIPVPESVGPQSAHSNSWVEGEYWLWPVYDSGDYFFDNFRLVKIGTYAEIWVQDNLEFLDGDPRNDGEEITVTDEQLEYMLAEFESNIYPIDTAYFGTPDNLTGDEGIYHTDAGYDYWLQDEGRIVILVENVADENYYDPTYPYYIAGLYWGYYEALFGRNIFTIDCWQWEQRTGPDGPRPYGYEGTFAHEFQHLIHDDYMEGTDTFMNEGCSMYAEIVCGYNTPWGDIEAFFATPDNSLTVWEDQGGLNTLADYGQVALWAAYLEDHYGPGFLSDYVQNGIPLVAGIEGVLAAKGFEENFDEVFHDWRIANFIHSGDGKYNYKSFDIGQAIEDGIIYAPREYEIGGRTIPYTTGTSFGNSESYLGTDLGISGIGPYGTDYIRLTNLKSLNLIKFQGDSEGELPPPPDYDWYYDYSFVPYLTEYFEADYYLPEPDYDKWWWSGSDDLLNTLLVADVLVDGGDPTLVFDTYFDFEPLWDYGFVQVSTDGGYTWTSLENAFTIYDHDSGAHPDVVENLPGISDWSADYAFPILTLDFDLSAYAGEEIMIGFRLVTDWATNYDNWYISDVMVSGSYVELYNVAPHPPPPVEINWMVTLLQERKSQGHFHYSFVWDMIICDVYDAGATLAYLFGNYDDLVLMISPIMDTGVFVDYGFKTYRITKKSRFF